MLKVQSRTLSCKKVGKSFVRFCVALKVKVVDEDEEVQWEEEDRNRR